MTPCKRVVWELEKWAQRSALNLLCLVVLAVAYSPAATIATEAITLHIPSTTVILPNGLTVVVSPKHKLPMVSMGIRFKAGSVNDPEDKAGLAAMTVRLLDKGTTQRTTWLLPMSSIFWGRPWRPKQEGRGALSRSRCWPRMSSPASVCWPILCNTRDSTPPNWSGAGTNVVRDSPAAGRARPRGLSAIPGNTVRRAPLTSTDLGYAHTVHAITREDVVAFHQRFYIPNNAIVVMVGALSEEHMLELIERHFGAWPARRWEPMALPQPTPTTGKQVRLVNMDVNQSYLQWGHLSVRRADPEFAAIRAMNYILGGGDFVSRLMDVIREQQGLAYAVDSEVVGGSQFPGFFAAELQTAIPTTAPALKSLFAVIESMQQAPVTPKELSDMKHYYEGSLAGRAETYEQVTQLLIEREFFGLPDGYWGAEIRQIQQLTGEDIQRLAQRYLDLNNFVLALVSKRENLDLADAPIPAESIREVPLP